MTLQAQKRSLILQKPKESTSESEPSQVMNDDPEAQNVQRVIEELFDAMRVQRGANVSHLFESGAILSSLFKSQLGNTQMQTNPAKAFIDAIAKPKTDTWDEKIWSYDIKIDGPLAKAWTPYTFYLNGQISHCGVNDFELVKKSGTWKINRIIDTRRKTDCTTDPIEAVNKVMDDWHQAAAVADENTFFGTMTEESIYIGTDASERWTKKAMMDFAMPYFQRESAWSFTAKSRNVTISDDGDLAWADELLDTWMGDCRSTAILKKMGKEWKIAYYHLSIAVPNDKVDGYLNLIGKQRRLLGR